MLRLKSCPKCKGDVLLDRDYYGWYEQCIQCGYLHDLETTIKLQEQETREEAKMGRDLSKYRK